MFEGIITEYYDEVRDALRVELKREPTHSEVMEKVVKIIDKHTHGANDE